MADNRQGKLALLFALFFLLLNYPILHIADRNELVFGFPKLYFYFFAIWAGLIFFMARVVRKRKR